MEFLQKQLIYHDNENDLSKQDMIQMVEDLLNVRWKIKSRGEVYTINLKDIGWTLGFKSMKRALGRCQTRGRKIWISTYFLNANPDKRMEWEDVVRHEIAHALDYFIRNTSDHGYEWKNIAIQVRAEPSAKTDAFTSGEAKYKATCNTCGEVSVAHKRRKREAACGTCCKELNNNKFDRKFILNFVVNPKFRR